MSMERLFVYGSLQPGGTNEHVLADVSGDWEPAVIRGKLVEEGWGATMGYPALVVDDGGEEVAGFVLSSTGLSAKWAELDEFEGKEYERVGVSVTLASGDSVQAYVYVFREG